MNKLDKYLYFSIGVVLIYTVISIVFTWFEHQLPSELTLAVYGFFAGEIVSCMLIKKFKLQSKEEESDERDF